MLKISGVIIGVVVVLLVLSNFLITKTFYTEVKINESPSVVWSFLVDKATYSKWNVILTPTESGEIREGEKVNYLMNYNNSESNFSAKIAKVIENQELNQRGGFFGLLTYDHKYLLKPTEKANETLLIQTEIDRGIGLLFWNSDLVEDAYKKSSENLKRLIEQGGR